MARRNSVNADDRDIIAAGYKPKLYRSLGFFSSFAVSFSWMSVLMGVFANYGYVLGKAGPFGVWTWLIVLAGQLLVSLVFAEMAGRISLTGALYNWNSKLSHPSVAVTVHWLTVFAYAIGGAGIVVAAMGPLQSFLGKSLDTNAIRLIGVSTFIVQFLINVYGVRLAAKLTRWAVAAEILAVIVFGAALLLTAGYSGQAHTELLTTIPSAPVPYLPAFLMCTLLGAWTIFGFETPSDLSEETVNVKRVAPKSIVWSVAASGLLGFFFILALTLAIPNLSAVSAAADPVSTIVSTHFGGTVTQIFLFIVLVAMFASSLLAITLASRLLFAVSRDKHFIGHEKFSSVSSHGIPLYAAALTALIEIVIFLTMYGLSALYASAVVLLFLAYLITVINFGAGVKKMPATNSFSLGNWHWPIVTLASIWLVGEIAILTIPEEFHLAAIIGGAIVVFSALQYPLHRFLVKTRYVR